jgi:predicted metal-dependent HD superfamily phosphohydrolase
MATLERWRATWRGLGVDPAPGVPAGFEALMLRHAEPHRHYHTVRHLQECFARLDELRSVAERPAEVEAALWFHDAIYDPRSAQNEAHSAELAAGLLRTASVAAGAVERIGRLILATRHAAVPGDADARVLVDADLAILGARPLRFGEYEAQIREEYAWVPESAYRRERARILRQFLERPVLFNTPLFVERYEPQARTNLERSLQHLEPP